MNWRSTLGLEIIDDWKRVISYSGSLWCLVAGFLTLVGSEAIFKFFEIDTNPYFWGMFGTLLYLAGIIGRFLKQQKNPWIERVRVLLVIILCGLISWMMTGKALAQPPTERETLSIAVPFIAAEEGKVNTAYKDIVGVWTICYGSTRGVTEGMVMSDEQCIELLMDEVAEYRDGLHDYFTTVTLDQRLTPSRDAAYTSTAFNCGIRAIGKSTATRRLNNDNIAGGCEALTWWNKAGGRVIRGLFLRRQREEALCMKGL